MERPTAPFSASAVPGCEIAHRPYGSRRLPHCIPVGSVTTASQNRSSPRHECRGRHNSVGVAARVNGGRFRAVSSSIDVVINGKARTVAEGTTVSALLGELGLGDKRVAVERNLEVVPRALHATTTLTDGDRLEVVTFVGGG